MKTVASCELCRKACVPCRGGAATLTDEEIDVLLARVAAWRLVRVGGRPRIRRTYALADFPSAIAFVDALARLASGEGHLPDLLVSGGRVRVELSTPAIGGLHESDFIVAAKVDLLFERLAKGA